MERDQPQEAAEEALVDDAEHIQRLDDLKTFLANASSAGLTVREVETDEQIYEFSLEGAQRPEFYRVHEYSAASLLRSHAERFVALPTYEAVWDPTKGVVECSIASPSPQEAHTERRIWDVPGVITTDTVHADTAEGEAVHDSLLGIIAEMTKSRLDWKLSVDDSETVIELSPPSPAFIALHLSFGQAPISLKIRQEGMTKQAGEILLSGIARDFLIDLDIAFGVDLHLRSRDADPPRLQRRYRKSPIEFPSNRYSPEVKELYSYASAASGFPLLQYLSYYQILENNFYRFSHSATIHAAQTLLRDPRFDIANEDDIAGLLSAIEAPARQKRELDLLNETLVQSVDAATLARFVSSVDSSSLVQKKQTIKGVSPLDVNISVVHESIAARVYAIRNRIVHSKDFDDRSKVEPLLPSSAEADALGPDLELIRWLAQRALIHNGHLRGRRFTRG